MKLQEVGRFCYSKITSLYTEISFLESCCLRIVQLLYRIMYLHSGNTYEFAKAASSDEFLSLEKSVRDIYNDKFVIQNMQQLLTEQFMHELVSDIPRFGFGRSKSLRNNRKRGLRSTRKTTH